jgi:secreted Zn-dependent insulinase-like peptidase
MCGLANKEHPVSRFTWGNIKSLKTMPEAAGVPVRERLQQFWAAHYSASRMALVVLGEQGLDELETMVRGTFSAVASDGEPRRKVPLGLDPWSDDVCVLLCCLYCSLFSFVSIDGRVSCPHLRCDVLLCYFGAIFAHDACL